MLALVRFLKQKNMFGYEDELQSEIEILRKKLERKKEINNELLNALKICYASLCTYGSHPIIENQVENVLRKTDS